MQNPDKGPSTSCAVQYCTAYVGTTRRTNCLNICSSINVCTSKIYKNIGFSASKITFSNSVVPVRFIMYWSKMLPITLAFLYILTQNTVLGQEFFMKTVPRNNRANDAPKNFENFFFKASKSVPRIGRRDSDMDTKYYEDGTGFYRPNGLYPKILKKLDGEKAKDPQMSFEDFFRKSLKSVPRIGRRDKMDTQYYEDGSGLYRPDGLYPKILKKFEPNLNELPWDNLADQIEYNPEFLMSPHLLAQVGLRDSDAEHEFVDKRAQNIKNQEIPECRIQPEA